MRNNNNNTQSPEKFNGLSPDDSLALALDYIERHFYRRSIFPIKAGEKFPPLLKDNLDKNASSDPAQIRKWAAKWPGCNWGVAHKKSGLMVVDVDCNAAKGKRGQETFDTLSLMYDFPDTETTTTPSGGFHKVYLGKHIMALGEHGIGKDIDSPNYTLIPGCKFADGTSYVGNGAEAVACPSWIYDVIKNTRASKKAIGDAGEAVIELDQPQNIKTAIDFLQQDAVAAIEGQNGDFNTLKTGMYLKDLGLSREIALDLMSEHYNPRCEPPWDRDDLAKKVENAFAYASLSKVGGKTAEADFADEPAPSIVPMGNPAKIEKERNEREARAVERREAAAAGISLLIPVKRPVVEMWPGRSHETLDAIEVNLLKQAAKTKNRNGGSKIADQLFKRDGKLVRLSRNLHKKQKASGAIVNADTREVDGVIVDTQYQELNALTVVGVRPAWLTTRLTRAIDFQGPSAGKPGKKPKLVPKDVKPNIINQLIEAGEWNFPPLHNPIEAPMLRADGTILDEPGYDPSTGMFFDPGRVKFEKIKQAPTPNDGKLAMEYLDKELLSSFPFSDPSEDYKGVSKSAAMALMLTAVTRRTFPIAPAFAADSNEPESGKSMLLKAAGALMTGREIAGRPFSQSEEERRKALGTAFVEARPFLFFDNVDCTIEGASLEMALTSPNFDDRKLGSHEGITAPTNSLIGFSANHLEVGGNGMTTRILVSRLIPTKSLKQRLLDGDYRHPLLIPWIVENRPRLIACALTALRSFVVHGKASAAPTISRFPEWGSLIGNALIWYGYKDPTMSGDAIRRADPVHEAMREVVRAWAQSFPDIGQPVTAAMLLASPTIKEGVAAATKIRPAELNTMNVGRYVTKLVGVGLGLNYQVDDAAIDQRANVRRWRLVLTREAAAEIDALL
jgi:Bifunctional DNA primase/polymerase, N-terminal